MASAFSHAIAALGIGACFYRPEVPKRIWVVGALAAVIPDLDVVGFRFGIHYGDALGHRGFSHSLVFAAFLAVLVTWLSSVGELLVSAGEQFSFISSSQLRATDSWTR